MQTNLPKPPGYESKHDGYFEAVRSEMLPFVPSDCKRVLDVGCGRGNFGKLLKQTRPVEVWGIEPVAAAAVVAATQLDFVIEGAFTPDANLPPASFDAIFFNDVLEHLLDPAAALRQARTLLGPGGVVIASIPNIRFFPTQWEVVVRGEWRYEDSGIMDRTHLRFFTRKSILALFADNSFRVEKIEGINPYTERARKRYLFKFINWLTFKAIEDMRFQQFAVVARPLAKAE